MIADRMAHAERWPLGAAWQSIAAELSKLMRKGDSLQEGKYSLPAGAFAKVESYTSKLRDTARYENHHLMADVQIVLQGEEYIEITASEGLTVIPDPREDLEFFKETPVADSRVLLKAGMFALILPEEAHMPGLAVKEPAFVKKLVAKIPAEVLKGFPQNF